MNALTFSQSGPLRGKPLSPSRYILAFATSMPKAELLLEDLLMSGQVRLSDRPEIEPAKVGGRAIGFNITFQQARHYAA